MEYSKKTQQDVSNLSTKVLKISSDTAKCEELYAKVIKLGASLETEMADLSNQNSQQDEKTKELISKVNGL